MSDKVLTFDERRDLYEQELINLKEKYNISLYAANVLMPVGEVQPVVKMFDELETV